ncbi:HD domain-containing protein [Actinocrispum wychmicini]|uniref:HD domain-containing protein n=1 Tax=Actinocrispum wychmicini TaxID=1213861 RepID=A0A4R2IIP0_9PSEU|nr:HD domain-containing protein [Actinocrispum wychmicini]TCO44794.1 HD domain-containing protein [Actinocrispum wychmicini]
MAGDLLRRALTDPGDPVLRPLPELAGELLAGLAAPPRLAAHLRAVHDVAWQLADWVQLHYPSAEFDRPAMLFGAATHDIGKTVHIGELSDPGSEHEQAGCEILLARGVAPDLARFARTHGSWSAPDATMADLLVSLADKIWKAKRVPDLEQLVIDRLVAVSDKTPWEVFMALDDELQRIAVDADRRLAFQASHPVRT